MLEAVVELVLSEELVAPDGGGGGGGGANETCDESEVDDVDDVELLADVKSAVNAVSSLASWLSSAVKLVADDELADDVVVVDDAETSD
ncbi:MAG: hypothetical protein P4L76_10345 [Beijerinckiaceae bacterium]|nr:hypothetical protein [Beijerinckiaceae bacterium]